MDTEKKVKKKSMRRRASPRGAVLAILGTVTLGVAVLSMAVTFQILFPAFGRWAVPTVGALDALWVIFQVAEIMAGNNRRRANRVRYAGLALTAVIAAIPTVDLIVGPAALDLAVVITPVAIVCTKTAWWLVLPALGEKVSAETRRLLAEERQRVADELEKMEAETANKVAFLKKAAALEEQVAAAETGYRESTLKVQQETNRKLHEQDRSTAKTVAEKPLSVAVERIAIPEFGTWKPAAPSAPVTRPALPAGTGERDGVTPETPGVTGELVPVTQASDPDDETSDEPSQFAGLFVTIEAEAAVRNVPVPQTDTGLTNEQIEIVLQALRDSEVPPVSYREAVALYRKAKFIGSEKRLRQIWAELNGEDETEEDEAAAEAEAETGA